MGFFAPIRSASSIEKIVKEAWTESDILDFKSTLSGWGDGRPSGDAAIEAQCELCRDIAQFANTLGGTLLVGIQERYNREKLKVASQIVGVSEPEQLKQWIDQVVPQRLVPQTVRYTVDAIQLSSRVVLAVNVEPQVRLVAVLINKEKYTQEYCRRTTYGRRFMSPDDVLTYSVASRRAGEISVRRAVDRLGAKSLRVRLVPGLVWLTQRPGSMPHPEAPSNVEVFFCGFSEEEFMLRVSHNHLYNVHVPYGAVRDAWCTSDGLLALALDYRIARLPSGVYELSEP